MLFYCLFLLHWLLLLALRLLAPALAVDRWRGRSRRIAFGTPAGHFRPAPHRRTGGKPKPPWVISAVLALHTECGSARKTAATFNRVHAHRGETVCKSTVQNWLHRHALVAQTVRRRTRNRMPRYVRTNHCWGVDGTGKRDGEGKEHYILGIIDHGTRRVLKLVALEQGTSRAILTELFDAVRQFGTPNMIRTDNASVFTSDEFHKALIAAGIRQWRTGVAMPWQNGRIERLFGTLKEKLNQITPPDFAALNIRLDQFAFWYNVVRPHQHLFGLTPMEAWCGVDPYRSAPELVMPYIGWQGRLRGVLVVR